MERRVRPVTLKHQDRGRRQLFTRVVTGKCAVLVTCAVDKRHESMTYGGSILERRIVKHPPHPDLGTGWGVQHGGKGPSLAIHTQRLRAELGWIRQERDCPKASSERCLHKHRGKWTETLATAPVRSKLPAGRLSERWAIHDECIQRNERPAYVQRRLSWPNCGISPTNPAHNRGKMCWREHLQWWL